MARRREAALLCCLLAITLGVAEEAQADAACVGQGGEDTCGGVGGAGKEGSVLVLGSGGLVGRAVVRWLEERGYTVLHVRNRRHIDLRVPGAMSAFDARNISYCFFLACEVGGSKFIESSERSTQAGIIDSNVRIYQEVLPYLARRDIPFVFTSSYLQETENSYGVVKRLGEQWVRNLGGLGKILRLWNVYGAENVGLKSHVLSDWAAQCVASGRAQSRTDGNEERQFVHVDDTAWALGEAMQRHANLAMESDISTGAWVDMRAVARALEEAASTDASEDTTRACRVEFASTPATHRVRLSPKLDGPLHQVWAPKISLLEGCRMLLAQYRERAAASPDSPPE